MRFEVGSAYAMGIGLPLLEALRRKTNFDNFHSYIDDFIAGGLLLYAAHAVATEKRGGDWKRSTLHDTLAGPEGEQQLDLLELDTALEELATLNPRHQKAIELRFFGGLTVDEAAHVLRVSPQTLALDWRMARAWLRRRLKH